MLYRIIWKMVLISEEDSQEAWENQVTCSEKGYLKMASRGIHNYKEIPESPRWWIYGPTDITLEPIKGRG
jgi:hypothetical protein